MRYVIVFFILFQFTSVKAQEEEIWYVWIDTQISRGENVVRLVSEKPIKITCCVKSPKFKRFQKKTAKWIRNNYDENFDLETPLKNIEDKTLADAVISEALEKSKADPSILMISYTASCK